MTPNTNSTPAARTFRPADPRPRAKSWCVSCKRFVFCRFGADAYQADVHDNHTPVWECEPCRHASAQCV